MKLDHATRGDAAPPRAWHGAFGRLLGDRIHLVLFAFVSGLLLLAAGVSFHLFHVLGELLSVAVGWALFLLGWNARDSREDNGILVVGIGFFFAGALDLLHVLSYRGMGLIPGAGLDASTKTWLAARLVQASALLAFPLSARSPFPPRQSFPAFGAAFLLLALGIFVVPVFPAVHLADRGLTPFAYSVEAAIIGLFAASALALLRSGRAFGERVRRPLLASILVSILAELAFVLIRGPGLPESGLAHLLKLGAYGLVYGSLLVTGMTRPMELLFRRIEEQRRDLARRDVILTALAVAAKRLLGESGETEVEAALETLGLAAGVHRAYVFETLSGAGAPPRMGFRHEWCASGIPRLRDQPGLASVDLAGSGFSRWASTLPRGLPLVGLVEELPPPERDFLTDHGTVSFAVMPVFLDGRWWGSVGFDDCSNRRSWGEGELRALEAAGELLCGAIERARSERRLEEQEARHGRERSRLELGMLEMAERERRRIGAELHDSLCQDLKSLEIRASILGREDPGARSIATDINAALRTAYDIAEGLVPLPMGAKALVHALGALGGPGGQRGPGEPRDAAPGAASGAAVTVRCAEEAVPAGDAAAGQLYGIAREAVTNALKHAKASRVEVILGTERGRPFLEVSDDGIGLPPGAATGPSLGIPIMRMRAEALGAELIIVPAPGGGTSLVCRARGLAWEGGHDGEG